MPRTSSPRTSSPRPRAELIAAYAYGRPAGALATTPPPPPQDATPQDADTAVTSALAEIRAALEKAQAAQSADPDADPSDEKITAGLDQISQTLDALDDDQQTDVDTEPDSAGKPPAKPAKPPPAVAAAAPPANAAPPAAGNANPVDADGNVDAAAKCANPDCQHLASAHVDLPEGANSGACGVAACACMGMQVESQPNSGSGGNEPAGNQGAQPGPQSQELAHAPAVAAPDAPAPPGPPSTERSELNEPPEIPGGENVGPAFTIPVAIIEGQPTGDGRQIAPGALTWRTPPLPLMGLATETHDPTGMDQNDPAVICGRIDSLERAPGESGTQIIIAKGYYLANDDGAYFAELNEQMGRMGVSADVAVQASEIEVGEIDEDGWPSEMSEILTEGQIMGLTVLPFPAFEGAYIVLGDGAMDAPAAPIPDSAGPPAMSEERTVTASIHWMTYEQCEPCQQGLELIASAAPERPPAAWFADPAFTGGDGRLAEILDRRGERQIGGKYACPLTITDEGRVYGHLAPWGVCHIGKPGCVTAPASKSDYAYFKRGQHVITAEGDRVRVGTITVNAGHADVHADPASAMAHYDNIALAAADVNAGEDEYGIWVAGAIRPTATPEQIAALRASSISGDWRGLGGNLELVAALAVPVPGFPHAVVAGAEQEALVAAGSSVMHRLKHPAPAPEPDGGDVALRRALAPLLSSAREKARERLSALR